MVGSRLRQYVIAYKLGEGGMGVVWKARDTTLDRDVALKVLPADGAASETRRERFFREARAASALNHPNIITVYEINSDGNTDFIAMELVEGETLSARIARAPMPLDEVVAIARQMAEAVARAHRAGIVHRDLKPGNVMINQDGLVKVLDFGLAKVGALKKEDERTGEETRLALTREGTALGTMGYMSPEQALGDPADTRSDVFSFGIILYQMLAGALPFDGHTNTEMLRALHFGEPKPLAAVRPDVPAWLDTVVARALAKEPKDRFADMGEVVVALRQPAPTAVSGDPAQRLGAAVGDLHRTAIDGAMGAIGRARGRRKKRRWPELQSALWIAVSMGFAVYYAVPWDRVLPRPAGESASTTAVSAPPAQLTLDGAALLLRYDRTGNIDQAIAALQRAVDQDPTYATAYAYLGQAYRLKNQSAPDDQWVKLAREHVQRALQLNSDLALAHVVAGYLSLDTGGSLEALQAFEAAVSADPLNAQALVGKAASLAAAKRDGEAAAAYTKALGADPADWRTHGEFGMFHYRRGRFAEAAAALESARRVTPDNVIVLRNLGAAFYRAGRADEAASTLQRALELQPTGPVYTNLGNIRFFQGQYAAAAAAFEKAVELDANTPLAWGNLGDAYRLAPGRRSEAPAAYARAIQLIDRQAASKTIDTNLRTLRAAYLAKMGEPRAAVEELDRVPDAALTAQMRVRAAAVYELAGDRTRALDMIGRALRAGYPMNDVERDPEFLELRSDLRYYRLISAMVDRPPDTDPR